MMLDSALALATLLTIAVASPALKTIKANVTQDFEHSVGSVNECGIQFCPNNVPGKSQSLLWSDMTDEFEDMSGSGNPAFQQAYTGYFYGSLNLSGVPSMTANYAGSRVAVFDLKSFAFGCSALFNVTDPSVPPGFTQMLGANCTMRVNGYRNFKGVPPKERKPAVTTDLHFTTGPVVRNLQGLPYYGMAEFKLPAKFAGLRTVTFTALPLKGPNYFGGLEAGIDTVKYVTTNVTLG